MLFEDNDFDINMNIFMPDAKINRDSKILEPMEGFLRGNMFKDEYEPYKNYTYYKLNLTTDKEKMLVKVMALSFAINDLNLYLDLHPDDKDLYNEFKKFKEEYSKTYKEYEKNYGPLNVCDTNGSNFNWINSPWPWNNLGGSMYV